jgi:flagellar assembly protein FliH
LSNPGKVIPKEQLSAYQRWEMAGLDAEKQPVEATVEAAVGLPTAEEIEQIHEQARQEGFAAGRDAGYQEGFAAGRQAAQAQADAIAQLLGAAEAAFGEWSTALEGEILTLTLNLTKQVLRHALAVKPELLLMAVREAMAGVPLDAGQLQLVAHPEDADLLRQYLRAEELARWQLTEDARISRGGFRIETANNTLDATMETRWQQLVGAFDRKDEWLES